MRIDDLSAFIQAHKLVSGRSCPEFVPSDLGVGCAYFNALQTARRIHSENAGGYIPLYAKSKYGLSRTFFMADDTPVCLSRPHIEKGKHEPAARQLLQNQSGGKVPLLCSACS